MSMTLPIDAAWKDAEAARAERYPLSRWWVRPLAGVLAARLARTWVRPVHLTGCGFVSALGAAATLLYWPAGSLLAAALVLAAWLFDRMDGQLARLQRTVTSWGAWLDANVDELADVGLHAVCAWAAAGATGDAQAPWLLFAAFVAGKYLFMYGLHMEESFARQHCVAAGAQDCRSSEHEGRGSRGWKGIVRSLYHLPANADVRVHVLALAIACGWLTTELACVAAYYNLRWMARFVLVRRRLGGSA